MFKKKKIDSTDIIPEVKVKKKTNKKVIRNIVIGGVVIVAAGLVIMPKLIPADTTPSVSVTAAYKGDVEEVLSTSGTVQSEKTKTYYSPSSATISDFTPVVGNIIHEGDQLVTFDTTDLENQYEQAKLQNTSSKAGYNKSVSDGNENATKYNNASTDVDVLNQQVTDAQNNVNNIQQAINTASNQVTQKQTDLSELQSALTSMTDAAKIKKQNTKIDKAQKAITDMQNYITDLNNQLITAQTDLSNCQTNLSEQQSIKSTSEAAELTANDKTQLAANTKVTELSADAAKANLETAQKGIVAEFDGIITTVTGEKGALAAEGASLFTVASNKEVKLNVTITKYDLDKVKEGQTAEITLAGSTYNGTISKINRVAANNTSGTPVITVEIHIENPDDNIYLGVEADVKIKEASATGVVLIPVEAINTDNDGDFCYVVENNLVVKKVIKTGVTSDSAAEVTEGLAEGDQVITTLTTDITEGMKVIPVTETK